jgi:hypothetical protein
MSEGQS